MNSNNKNVKFRSSVLLIFVLIIQFRHTASAGGTVVGDAGDPIFEFMESARFAMIETLKVIANEPDEQKLFCQQSSLNSDQIQFCHDYFLSITKDMLRLSQGINKTLFVLRENPFEVIGPDGKPMVAAARTLLGPDGPIELHRDSVKTLIPTQVLFLIAHEFQHKSNFNGIYVGDNNPIGPFANGRDLIDAAAKSLVSIARRKGKIGSQFGIRDIYDCLVQIRSKKIKLRIVSSRIFKSEDLMTYESSSGKNPNDGVIALPESNNEELMLRFVINEPNNCSAINPDRKTTIQIIRTKTEIDGSIHEMILANTNLSDNPICPGSNHQFSISWDRLNFNCKYFGSNSITDSKAPLN